jgi:hypothetical protein
MDSTLTDYFAAWNEPDPDRRAAAAPGTAVVPGYEES